MGEVVQQKLLEKLQLTDSMIKELRVSWFVVAF